MKGIVLDERALVMHGDDTVATALADLEAGETIEDEETTIELREEVPFGHKVALSPIEAGETVRKYGEVIGRATERIEAGEWVHTHNCESTRGRGDRSRSESDSGVSGA